MYRSSKDLTKDHDHCEQKCCFCRSHRFPPDELIETSLFKSRNSDQIANWTLLSYDPAPFIFFVFKLDNPLQNRVDMPPDGPRSDFRILAQQGFYHRFVTSKILLWIKRPFALFERYE